MGRLLWPNRIDLPACLHWSTGQTSMHPHPHTALRARLWLWQPACVHTPEHGMASGHACSPRMRDEDNSLSMIQLPSTIHVHGYTPVDVICKQKGPRWVIKKTLCCCLFVPLDGSLLFPPLLYSLLYSLVFLFSLFSCPQSHSIRTLLSTLPFSPLSVLITHTHTRIPPAIHSHPSHPRRFHIPL